MFVRYDKLKKMHTRMQFMTEEISTIDFGETCKIAKIEVIKRPPIARSNNPDSEILVTMRGQQKEDRKTVFDALYEAGHYLNPLTGGRPIPHDTEAHNSTRTYSLDRLDNGILGSGMTFLLQRLKAHNLIEDVDLTRAATQFACEPIPGKHATRAQQASCSRYIPEKARGKGSGIG